jgi:hypothetical protein
MVAVSSGAEVGCSLVGAVMFPEQRRALIVVVLFAQETFGTVTQ